MICDQMRVHFHPVEQRSGSLALQKGTSFASKMYKSKAVSSGMVCYKQRKWEEGG